MFAQNGTSARQPRRFLPPGWDDGQQDNHSDTDTERGYRSTSRSDLSSGSTRQLGADRVSASIDAFPDPAPPIPYWSAKRHLTCGNPSPAPPWSKPMQWRGNYPGKLKTANAALVLCLNIDVDPPDVVKTNPCAVLECWVDPHSMPSHKALEAIGTNLQHQFEGLSLKIPYKPILDPSLEDLRRFCQSLRRTAKDDAVLFYYNGHGVPKPTPSGELWCFNRNYTQYIPVSLQEVQSWLGSPGVYIWDCSGAGNLLQNFNVFAERRDKELSAEGSFPENTQPMMNSLQLAACAANETLPTCPELPADVFTSCLTSPIDIALRYYIMNHQLPNNISVDMVMQLPGDLKDRRTPLGELNWLFTAVTDTIAWTTFSQDIFTRLYRSDLLIASLFRNFLLAERIMKSYHCTPHTWPPLPPTNTHTLWATWDLAVDTCLRQLPDLLFRNPDPTANGNSLVPLSMKTGRVGQGRHDRPGAPGKSNDKPYIYVPSRFFTDQLTAFEVWISRGGSALTRRGPMSLPPGSATPESTANGPMVPNGSAVTNGGPPEAILNGNYYYALNDQHHLVPRKPPDQLPIVLQVLLSQHHRLRALILLSQFVDLGPWAVHLVLLIGIFPYISKLLQAAGPDLRPVLIFIWARILAVNPSVQTELLNNSGYRYFSSVLAIKDENALPNSSEHKAMCSFILSAIARDLPAAQAACWKEGVWENCVDLLEEPDFLLRQWTALCIAQMWDANDELKAYGESTDTQSKLVSLLSDDSAEVRSAALFALCTFLGASGSSDPKKKGGGGTGSMGHLDERSHLKVEVSAVTGAALAIREDASPMCRKELCVVISCLVREWRGYFAVCAWIYWEEDRKWRAGQTGGGAGGAGVPGSGPAGLSGLSALAALNNSYAASSSGASTYSFSSSYSQTQAPQEDMVTIALADYLDSASPPHLREENRVLLSSFFTIFVILLDMTVDPYNEVAAMAQTIVDWITACLLESPFARVEGGTLGGGVGGGVGIGGKGVDGSDRTPTVPKGMTVVGTPTNPPIPGASVGTIEGAAVDIVNLNRGITTPTGSPRLGSAIIAGTGLSTSTPLQQPAVPSSGTTAVAHAPKPGFPRAETGFTGGVTSTLRRTSSFANALKSLAGGIAFPTSSSTGGSGGDDGSLSGSTTSAPGSSIVSEKARSGSGSGGSVGGEKGVAFGVPVGTSAGSGERSGRPPSPNLNVVRYAGPYERAGSGSSSSSASIFNGSVGGGDQQQQQQQERQLHQPQPLNLQPPRQHQPAIPSGLGHSSSIGSGSTGASTSTSPLPSPRSPYQQKQGQYFSSGHGRNTKLIAYDVIVGLIEEDMERLRARKRAGMLNPSNTLGLSNTPSTGRRGHGHGPHPQPSFQVPLPPNFSSLPPQQQHQYLVQQQFFVQQQQMHQQSIQHQQQMRELQLQQQQIQQQMSMMQQQQQQQQVGGQYAAGAFGLDPRQGQMMGVHPQQQQHMSPVYQAQIQPGTTFGGGHAGTPSGFGGGALGPGGMMGLGLGLGLAGKVSESVIAALGAGTGTTLKDILPLKSTFFDWCCEYFKEPQMRQAEPDEPGSVQYNYQVWRQQRNEQIISDTQKQGVLAEGCLWNKPVTTIHSSTGFPLTMAFHSYDDQLVVANENDMISVWDWTKRKRLNSFCNGNPKGTSITAMNIINQDVGGIIIAGTSDGIVRLYRNYDPSLDQGPLQLVSAFRALNEVVQVRQGAGLVMDWKQAAGTLLVGGDSRAIKMWDAQTETQGLDLDTNSESPVTCIVSDNGAAHTFIATFADGMVKIFDKRIEEGDPIVSKYSDHRSWVQNARWHPTKNHQFLTAAVDGEVKLWDIRTKTVPIQTWNIYATGLSAFDVHPLTNVFAATSNITPNSWRSHRVTVHSFMMPNEQPSTQSFPTGLTMSPLRALASPYVSRMNSLVFHPTEMLYALGQPDGSIKIMGCNLAGATTSLP